MHCKRHCGVHGPQTAVPRRCGDAGAFGAGDAGHDGAAGPAAAPAFPLPGASLYLHALCLLGGTVLVCLYMGAAERRCFGGVVELLAMQGTELTQKQVAHALQPAFKFFARGFTVDKARLLSRLISRSPACELRESEPLCLDFVLQPRRKEPGAPGDWLEPDDELLAASLRRFGVSLSLCATHAVLHCSLLELPSDTVAWFTCCSQLRSMHPLAAVSLLRTTHKAHLVPARGV